MFDWFETLDAFGTSNGTAGWASPPSWNSWTGLARHDTPEAVVYTLSVPGFRRKDIEIEVCDGIVTVRGNRKDGLFRPRAKSSFVQTFTLPETLDEQDVRADLHDGVLSLTFAKRPEARARRIPILVAGQSSSSVGQEGEAGSKSHAEGWWNRIGSRFRRNS